MQVAFPHIADRLFGRTHAIEPVAFRAIMEGPMAKRILAGEKIGGKQVKKGGRDLRRARLAAIVGASQVRMADGLIEYAITPDGIAIIPISGVLSQRFDWLAAACGWTTYEGLTATINSAVEEYAVRGILLDVDSPGGEANGMLDAADAILEARKEKPVWAVANACAASAGYALAASAEKLVLPRIAIVGSIGCMMVHVDQSRLDASIGLSYTAIFSGARKMDGWGHAPISDAALKAAQDGVDHVRDQFAALVGRQGRISAKAALETEAAIYADSDAVKAGLADAVMSFDAALAALTQQTKEAAMAGKTTLLQTSSPAALAAATTQPPAANSEAPEQHVEAQPAAPAAKKSDDMTPPKPGEKCQLCGQKMPENDGEAGDENGDDEEQETRASAVTEYTAEHAGETLDLCTIAGRPELAAAFVRAKTPIKKVRSELLRVAAESASDDIDATRPPDAEKEKQVAAAWDQVVGELNEKQGFTKKPGK